MAKKITMDFVRWGAMSPQKHVEAKLPENSEERWFHTAPTVWGIYAFPRGFVYGWLLGMSAPHLRETNRVRWVKDAKGHRVREKDIWGIEDEHERKKKINRLSRLNHMERNGGWGFAGNKDFKAKDYSCYYWDGPGNKFKYGGDIWHHLEFFYYEYNDSKYGRWPDPDECPVISKKIRIVPMQDIIEHSGSWIKTSIRDYRKALKKFNDCREYYEKLGIDSNRKNICYISSPDGCDDIKAQMEVFIEKV